MTSELTITIPGNPSAKLSPNARGHWGKRNKAKTDWYDSAYSATHEALNDATDWRGIALQDNERIVIRYDVFWGRNRKTMDDDNLITCMKSARDAISHALGFNDVVFSTGEVSQHRDTSGRGFVVVTLMRSASDAGVLRGLHR